MITVNEHSIDFDITAPDDLRRYLDATDRIAAEAANAPAMPATDELGTRDGLHKYAAYIEGQCKLLTDFVDCAFGDGTCNALLGPKTSLDGLLDMVATLRDAVEEQGAQAGQRIAAYMPNRTTSGKQ